VTRSIENTSAFRKSGSGSHGASEAEELQETHDSVEQMARHLVAMRLANLHETTAHEEQRA
jgi:hypothetical protein